MRDLTEMTQVELHDIYNSIRNALLYSNHFRPKREIRDRLLADVPSLSPEEAYAIVEKDGRCQDWRQVMDVGHFNLSYPGIRICNPTGYHTMSPGYLVVADSCLIAKPNQECWYLRKVLFRGHHLWECKDFVASNFNKVKG